jgi:hypothetical protein
VTPAATVVPAARGAPPGEQEDEDEDTEDEMPAMSGRMAARIAAAEAAAAAAAARFVLEPAKGSRQRAGMAVPRPPPEMRPPPRSRGAPPETGGEEHKGRKQQSSHHIGVYWHTASASWYVYLWDGQTKHRQHIGSFASEEDAARAYDCAAVQAHGPGAKLNFPGETIGEPSVSKVEERKQQSSRYRGVIWDKASSSWVVQLQEQQHKRKYTRHIGYASEEDAARAYDGVALHVHGPGARLNFRSRQSASRSAAARATSASPGTCASGRQG